MKLFEVDIKRLSILLLPTFLRKKRTVAWLYSLVSPIDSLHYSFIQKRERDLYKLSHNGQVCYLRAALNDKFDIDKRRIKIVDGNSYKREYIYTRGEQLPKYLGPVYLYSPTDYEDTGLDFIVEVPREIVKKNEMDTFINFYRLASKRHKIMEI